MSTTLVFRFNIQSRYSLYENWLISRHTGGDVHSLKIAVVKRSTRILHNTRLQRTEHIKTSHSRSDTAYQSAARYFSEHGSFMK